MANNCFDVQMNETIRWTISIAVPSISGLCGVILGAWLTGWREKVKKQIDFAEKQLSEFYSPMLGLRREIQMRGSLRVNVQEGAEAVWKELCEKAQQVSDAELADLTQKRECEFASIISYDNRQIEECLLPSYREMVKMFRERLWLAEPDTQGYFPVLLEFVELWERFITKSIPIEVIQRLGHTENRLKEFYLHIEERHNELRRKISCNATKSIESKCRKNQQMKSH